ncbi:hypothetical protein HAX54_037114 [Datura stramonium]|uniref:Uncharacterized protein n=1 Tax=Datura stramonium TaxID=4076 RepID=A0ABS8VHU0_DATST|nr:hypothetical protein [Datura stramonium]
MGMENQGDNGQLLPRASTLPSITYNFQRRKRKPLIKTKSTPPRLSRQASFSREIGHAAAETYLITGLSFKLLSYLEVRLSVDYKIFGSCLICNATYAWFSPSCILLFLFTTGPAKCCLWLDLYLPAKIDSPKPVVVFVTGGAWIIGYKYKGSLLGKAISRT